MKPPSEEWLRQMANSRPMSDSPDVKTLLGITEKLSKARALTQRERTWLQRLLGEILFDVDVRDRFHKGKRPGPPSNPMRDLGCAVWIASRTAPGPHRMTVGDAKFAAEKRFRMSEAQVHRAWIAYRRRALELRSMSLVSAN